MAVTAIKTTKNTVESLRDIVQDLVAPDLKALRVTVDSHRNENTIQFEALRREIDALRDEVRSSSDTLRSEMRSSNEALRSEMRSSNEALRTEMRVRDEKQSIALQAIADKLGTILEVRERLAVLEDRLPRA